MESVVIWMVIGAVAGWLAGMIIRGNDFSLIGNIVIGVLGSLIGGLLFGNGAFGTAGGVIGAILSATVGAVLLLLLIRFAARRTT